MIGNGARTSGVLMGSDAETRVDAALNAAAALTLRTVNGATALARVIPIMRGAHSAEPMLVNIPGGILAFASAVFPNTPLESIYAKFFAREPGGRGAHFDVYGTLLSKRFPWVALRNLQGICMVSTFPLPAELSQSYRQNFPFATDEAFQARRAYSAEAHAALTGKPEKGFLMGGEGFLIPQPIGGPDWVHEVTPTLREDPGAFIKLLVPADRHASLELHGQGYCSLDQALTDLARDAPPASLPWDGDRRRSKCNLD